MKIQTRSSDNFFAHVCPPGTQCTDKIDKSPRSKLQSNPILFPRTSSTFFKLFCLKDTVLCLLCILEIIKMFTIKVSQGQTICLQTRLHNLSTLIHSFDLVFQYGKFLFRKGISFWHLAFCSTLSPALQGMLKHKSILVSSKTMSFFLPSPKI